MRSGWRSSRSPPGRWRSTSTSRSKRPWPSCAGTTRTGCRWSSTTVWSVSSPRAMRRAPWSSAPPGTTSEAWWNRDRSPDQNTAVSPPGPIGGDDGPEAHPGDMARRITRRRTDLGQSIEEVAEKAGVDPGYLRYFEESAEGRLSAGTVLLVALALECSPEDLYGGVPARQPGRGRAG